MNQSVLENPGANGSETPGESSGGGILKWLIVTIVILIIGGGGYWYYANYIIGTKGQAMPSPSVEVTVAIWKIKSEKTITDFLDFWLKSSSTSDGLIQANKARDLLTIVAQAKLETTKDANGKDLSDLSAKLNYFLGSAEKARSYEIISTQKIDENTVTVKVNLIYTGPKVKVFTVTQENNIWLIDKVVDSNASSPSPSPSISPSISPTPTGTSS